MTIQNDERDPLTRALRGVAQHDADAGASSRVEARLLAEVRQIAKGQRRQALPQWIAAAAALVLIVAGALWWTRTIGPDAIQVTGPRSEPTATEIKTDFLPLPYSSVPTPSVRLVRLEVPRQALVSFGLASGDLVGAVNDSGTATVTADVLVGDDGLARAVRFVRPIGRRE
jgi:hypothetical protein